MLSLASTLVFFVMTALVPGVVIFGNRPSTAPPGQEPTDLCETTGIAPGERRIARLLEAKMDWSLARPRQVDIVAVTVETTVGITALSNAPSFSLYSLAPLGRVGLRESRTSHASLGDTRSPWPRSVGTEKDLPLADVVFGRLKVKVRTCWGARHLGGDLD